MPHRKFPDLEFDSVPAQSPAAARSRLLPSRTFLTAALVSLLWLTWQVIRLPLLALLVILEPVVQFVLSTAALLVLLTAIFWVLFDPRPGFPLCTFIAFSLGAVALLALYHAVIRFLAGAR